MYYNVRATNTKPSKHHISCLLNIEQALVQLEKYDVYGKEFNKKISTTKHYHKSLLKKHI